MPTRMYRDREFELLDDVYDPGEDSLLLLEAALAEVRPGEKVLEVGTGSGIVSMFLKDHAEVVATDINPSACRNAKLNGVEVLRTDLIAGICGTFDLVIFNPPYLPTAEDEKIGSWLNRAFDGGPSGRDVIARFLEDAGRVLPPCSRILTVISTLTDVDAVAEMYKAHGFSVDQVMEEKVPFEKLVVLKCVRTG